MVDAEVVRDTISAKNLVIRPDARASLQINLITEIVVTGVDDEEHDVTLNFLALLALRVLPRYSNWYQKLRMCLQIYQMHRFSSV